MSDDPRSGLVLGSGKRLGSAYLAWLRPHGRTLLEGLVVTAVWTAVGWAIGRDLGLYDPTSIATIAVAAVVLVAFVVMAPRPAAASATLVAGALIAAAVASWEVTPWSYVGGPVVGDAHLTLELAALAVIPLAIASKTRRLAVLLALAAGLAASFAVISVSTAPSIDVWFFLQQSAAGLVHGQNMYTSHWVGSPGITYGYTYMPWTTVVLVPFRELLGDVRFGLACATAVGAAAVYHLARGSGAVAPMLAMLVFAVPSGLILVESAWTEPLLLAYLSCAILAALDGRTRIAIACLALAVATKQFTWPLLPLFAVWRPFGLRRTVAATVAGFAISLPWIVASPTAFWHGVITDLYDRPTEWFSLSLAETLARHHETMPFAAVVGIALVALLIGLRYTWRIGNVAFACAELLLVFDAVNHDSFFNQYWLVAELLVVGWALSIRLSLDGSPASERPPLLPRVRRPRRASG